MSASPQPFTDHVTGRNKSSPSAWIGWIVAVVMAALAAVFVGLWNSANAQHQKDVEISQTAQATAMR